MDVQLLIHDMEPNRINVKFVADWRDLEVQAGRPLSPLPPFFEILELLMLHG